MNPVIPSYLLLSTMKICGSDFLRNKGTRDAVPAKIFQGCRDRATFAQLNHTDAWLYLSVVMCRSNRWSVAANLYIPNWASKARTGLATHVAFLWFDWKLTVETSVGGSQFEWALFTFLPSSAGQAIGSTPPLLLVPTPAPLLVPAPAPL
jgi:hypothetical protein